MLKNGIILFLLLIGTVAGASEEIPAGEISVKIESLEPDYENPLRSARKSLLEVEKAIEVSRREALVQQSSNLALRAILGNSSPLAANAKSLSAAYQAQGRELALEREALIGEIQAPIDQE